MKAIAFALMLTWLGTCVAEDGRATDADAEKMAVEAVRAKIIRFIVLPCGDFPATLSLRMEVVLLPDGGVLGSKIVEASGYSPYDLAVERALLKAQPIPMPQSPELKKRFTHLDLRFTPGQAGTSCDAAQMAEFVRPPQSSGPGISYPSSARAKGLEGLVVIRVLVLANSTIGESIIFESSGVPELDAAALEGVQKWRFAPAKSESGKPVDHWVEIPIRFRLQASEKKSVPPTTDELNSYIQARREARETEVKTPTSQRPDAAPITTPSNAMHGNSNDVLVYVNRRPISKLVFEAMLQSVVSKGQDPNDPRVRDKVNDELVSRELLVQYAVEIRLGKYPEPEEIRNIADAQALIAKQATIAAAVLQSYAKSNPVSEKAMRGEYDRVRGLIGDKEYKASHILVASEAEASQLIADIKAGGSFETIAFQKSLDPGSKQRGGDLGWASAARYVDPFAIALDSLKKGQVTDKPVHTQFGWHVVRVDDVRPARVPSFENIKNELLRNMQNQAAQKLIASLRAKAVIATVEDKKTATPTRPEVPQAAPSQAKIGEGKDVEMSGVFQIVRLSRYSAELAYLRQNKDTGRKEKEIITVSVVQQEDIRVAVVRKIISLIREVDKEDFVWNSLRLGRQIWLSARLKDTAGLEEFMLREFFPSDNEKEPAPATTRQKGTNATSPDLPTLDDLKYLMRE